MREGTNLPGGVMATFDFAKLSLKLDEIEDIFSAPYRSGNAEKYFS